MLKRTFSFWRRLAGRHAAPSKPHERDRRIWVRYPAKVETTVQSANRNRQIRLDAFIENVSKGGARFATNRAFNEGDMITLELPIRGATQSVLACVVRVSEKEPKSWTIGCVFSKELSVEELENYGAQREKHDDADQRHWVRYPCTTHASFRCIDTDDETHSAHVLDISANGVGLIADHPIDTGTLLNIELSNDTGRTQQVILGCVVHVSEYAGNKWALGCNFIRELSEQDLLALR